MHIDVELFYRRHNVIPPRCRKPRTVTETGHTTIEIPEVTAADAPVAFRVPWYSFEAETNRWDEYRWWGGRVFERFLPWSRQKEPSLPGSDHFPVQQGHRAPWDSDGLDAAIESARTEFSKYLIVDGVVWCEAWGEPRYEIYTLGLGHNHSGSGVSYTTSYNGNISRERYFRADRHKEAIAAAKAIAIRRGDTDSVARIETTLPIEVLIPEAVRINPAVEHGDGDPFLNRLYGISEAAPDSTTAGLGVLSVLAQELSQ